MPIVVTCPKCPTKLSAPDAAAGKQVRCPKCGAAAPVPAFIPAEEVPVVDAAVVPPKPKPKPVVADDDDDDRPRKKSRREEEDADEGDSPRKKKRRYDDEDDDPPRRKRRKAGGGSGAGAVIAVVVLGVLLVVGAAGAGVYFLTGKGSASAKKAPVPPGWQQYSYPDDGVNVYLPENPTRISAPLDGIPLDGGRRGGFGMGGWRAGNEMHDAERYALYACGDLRHAVHVEVWVVRFRNAVPKSVRDEVRAAVTGRYGDTDTRAVKWLGHDAAELTHLNGVLRLVYTDRCLIMASIGGPNGRRAKPEEEAGFFDNFEATR